MKEWEGPRITSETGRLGAERRARLAAQLRANLARRKAQRRERVAADFRAAKSLEPAAK
jgi:hypothetical protein